MKKNGKIKNNKLFFQISIILIPIFLLITVGIMWLMYSVSIDEYLKAQNVYIEDAAYSSFVRLNEILDKDLNWYLKYCEEHPDVMNEKLTEEESKAYNDFVDQLGHKPESYTDEVSGHSELIERAYAKITQNNIVDIFADYTLSFYNTKQTYSFIMDTSEQYMGTVIYAFYSHGTCKKTGERFDFDLSDHSGIKKLMNNPMENSVFERAKDFPDEGNYYICYIPIAVNGEVKAVFGVASNWDDFRAQVLFNLRIVFMIILAGLLFVIILMQYIIYSRAVSPIKKIQRVVREYTQDKDSGKVISQMTQIKEKNEFGLLSEDISGLAKEIEYYTSEMVKLTGERERAAAELEMAKKIQADQLPSDFPAFPGREDFDIYASMTPAKEVGGDFYDFFLVDDYHLALVIADVSGKGVPAALFMMMSKNLIRNLTMMGLSPKEVMERANQTICANNKQKMFVTVWLGILEISTGKVTAVNAGHEIPIIHQPGGEFAMLEEPHGLIAGLFDNARYTQYEFALQKGGTLFVYTDGVAEAANTDDEQFGEQRITQVLCANKGKLPKELLESVHAQVNEFVGQAQQFDDLTMLAVTLKDNRRDNNGDQNDKAQE
ncbi:PP2C family protein-serine/threonine phosphatase [Ruminococcus sp. FC2018]|uniref:PP2C family protein-serine/threonine phosphatase n=1 Tax=Ruminococcus sp. FC2018 TaxID=1410617 RepID=UPI00068566ED|nr:PP2C family protein-serine/threonine phosphatase [Ruminococcus sp. FC2018]